MDEFFENRTECFNYLKLLYEQFVSNFSDQISESDISVSEPIYSKFWQSFRSRSDFPKNNKNKSFFYFSMNMLEMNFERLNADSLSQANMETPIKEEFTLEFKFRESVKKRGNYTIDVEGVITKDQLEQNLDDFSDDWMDYYNHTGRFDTVNSELDEVDLRRIWIN